MKYYGLTDKPNKDVKDKAPDWMNSLFEKQISKVASNDKAKPFDGVNDKILNPSSKGVKKEEVKCEHCGTTLQDTDVDVCTKCTQEK